MFCTDAENKYVGIGTNVPQAQLHILESGNTLVVPTDTLWLMQHSGSAGDSGYMGIVGGSTGDVGIWFGDETYPPDGYITYENDTDDLVLDATDDIVLDCDTIDLDGGQRIKRTTVNDDDYTVLVTDYYITYSAMSEDRDLTLPRAADAGAGAVFIIKDELNGAYTITVAGYSSGGETDQIEGSASMGVSSYGSLKVMSTGVNDSASSWVILP